MFLKKCAVLKHRNFWFWKVRSFETPCVLFWEKSVVLKHRCSVFEKCAVLKHPVFCFWKVRTFETACLLFWEKCTVLKSLCSVFEKCALLKQPVTVLRKVRGFETPSFLFLKKCAVLKHSHFCFRSHKRHKLNLKARNWCYRRLDNGKTYLLITVADQ